MRDLEFDIRARDKTADAFNSARHHAREFNGDLDRTKFGFDVAATAARAFAAAFTVTAVANFGRVVREVVTEAADLVDLADKVGVTTDELQRMVFGFAQAGVQASDVDGILTQWSKRIGEAYSQGGKLADVLKANGVALTDGNGRLRSSVDLMREYADLLQNAASDQERMELATLGFGRAGAAMVLALKDGAVGMDELMRAVDEAGGVIDEELLRKAAEVDDEFNRLWRNFEINSKSAILQAVDWLSQLRDKADEYGRSLRAAELGEEVGRMAGMGPRQGPASKRDRLGDRTIDDAQRDFNELRDRWMRRTVIPGGDDDSKKRTASAKAAREQESAYEKVIQRLAEEQEMLGLNATEQRILVEQRRAGVTATSAEGRAIAEKIRAIEAERAALEALEDQQEAMNETAEYLGEVGFDALEAIITKSESASDAVKKLGLELLKAALYAMLFNEGPLAGLFGGWLLGGGSSGIITTLKTPQLSGMAGVGAAMLASAKASAGGSASGTSLVKVELSKDLVARIVNQADTNAVRIVGEGIAEFAPTIPDRIADYQRDPRRR